MPLQRLIRPKIARVAFARGRFACQTACLRQQDAWIQRARGRTAGNIVVVKQTMTVRAVACMCVCQKGILVSIYEHNLNNY